MTDFMIVKNCSPLIICCLLTSLLIPLQLHAANRYCFNLRSGQHAGSASLLGPRTSSSAMSAKRENFSHAINQISASFARGADVDVRAPGDRTNQADWKLIWSDEFNGRDRSPIDATKWTAQVGGNGWGNQELEYYTNRLDNAYQSGGSLVIKSIKEKYTGADNVTRDYTSARLTTRKKFTAKYGRFEARIRIPYGQGLWPAFWMLGETNDSLRWPESGEIDIMENIGREPGIIHGTIHGPGYSGAKGPSSSYLLTGDQRFADSFHIFAVEWEPNVIRFYCDGALYKTRTPADLPAGTAWVYDHPFFIILNVAVGGSWPGNPDETTVWPQTMLVDYVRVYQRVVRG